MCQQKIINTFFCSLFLSFSLLACNGTNADDRIKTSQKKLKKSKNQKEMMLENFGKKYEMAHVFLLFTKVYLPTK